MENSTETVETKTVQKYRHSAKRHLVEARSHLALRTDETREAYLLLNGSIEGILAGRSGYSQEEQVERLTRAKDTLIANLAALPEKVEAAKASILAQVEAWEDSITNEADKAVSVLDEAIAYAAERDFAEHQKRKGRYAPYGTQPVVNDEDDYDPEDEEGDTTPF